MFKKRLQNEEGVIFVTVLVIVIVTTLLAISIYSLNTSQAMLAEEEVRFIQGEMIAQGENVRFYGSNIQSSVYIPGTYTGTPFSFSSSVTANAGPNNTDILNLNISF